MPNGKVNRGNSLVSHPFRIWFDLQIREDRPTNHIYTMQQSDGKIPPELQVSKKTIAEYRNNILKINSEVVKTFKEEKEKAVQEAIHREIIQEPENQIAIAEKTALLIDADQTFIDMHAIIKRQITKLAAIEDPKTRAQIDVASAIGELCDQMRLVTMDFLKIQGKLRETPQTQINIVSIEKNNAEMEALKTCIVDIINEIDPSALPRFFDLLKQRVDPIIEAYNLKRQNILTTAENIAEQDATKMVEHLISSAEEIK